MAARDSTRVDPHVCVTCGAVFTPVKYRKAEGVFRAYTGRQNCSAECAFKAKGVVTKRRMAATRERWVGPNNPMWIGACLRRNMSYRGSDWGTIAERARERDGHACAHCGMTQEAHTAKWSQALEVHHKVPFYEFTDHRKANRASNLVTLCKVCHMTADRAIRNRQFLLPLSEEQRKKPRVGAHRGSANGRAKLSEAQVSEIKTRLRAGERQQSVAGAFGVTKYVISAISTGQNWAHVP